METIDKYLIKNRLIAPRHLFVEIYFIDIRILKKIVITFIVVVIYRQAFF